MYQGMTMSDIEAMAQLRAQGQIFKWVLSIISIVEVSLVNLEQIYLNASTEQEVAARRATQIQFFFKL
jgi:hypothetical protein